VVLADPSTSELGGAVASCVGDYDLSDIVGLMPGVGGFAAQGLVPSPGRAALPDLLANGGHPDTALSALADPAFDADAQERQYGIALLSGDAGAFTGSASLPVAGHRHGTSGAFVYSVQGNALTDEAMLDRMVGELAKHHCDVVDALTATLQAAIAGDSGDARCADAGVDSDSAHLEALLRSGTSVEITRVDTANRSATLSLLSEVGGWRAMNPCDEADASTDDVGPTDPPKGDEPPTDKSIGATGAGSEPDDSSSCAVRALNHRGDVARALLLVAGVGALSRMRRRQRPRATKLQVNG
jgi:uncharacterized Ntn-hydrolase superfamily protein